MRDLFVIAKFLFNIVFSKCNTFFQQCASSFMPYMLIVHPAVQTSHLCSSSSSSSSSSSVVSWTQVVDICVQSIVRNNFQSQKKTKPE